MMRSIEGWDMSKTKIYMKQNEETLLERDMTGRTIL